ncbi:MAG: hypothetical protein HFK03_05065 [Clostridia bacterium]|jgi:hypothetical protein|nr:hypothetical protein [Clostridia bacterium]
MDINNEYYISEYNATDEIVDIVDNEINIDDIHESAQAIMETISKYVEYCKRDNSDDSDDDE